MITDKNLFKFMKHFKGRKRSAEATLKQYKYHLSKAVKILPTSSHLIDYRVLNNQIKLKEGYHFQHMMRASILRWLEYICYLDNVNWSSISEKSKNELLSPRGAEYKLRARNITEEQKTIILNNVKEVEQSNKFKYIFPLYLSLKLLFETGLRRAEFLKLEPRHFDLKKKRIYLSAEISKGKEDRYVYYFDETSKLLISYLKKNNWITDDFLWKPKKQKTIFILRNKDNKILKFQDIRFTQLVSKVIFPGLDGRGRMPKIADKFTPHKARHTFAKKAAKHMDVRSVQIILGHKKLETTEIYLGGKDHEKAEKDFRKMEKEEEK